MARRYTSKDNAGGNSLHLCGRWHIEFPAPANDFTHVLKGDAVDRFAELEDQAQWIPVNERLPEYGKDVLAFAKNKYAGKGVILLTRTRPHPVFTKIPLWKNVDDMEDSAGWSVTHWMPLPSPPEA